MKRVRKDNIEKNVEDCLVSDYVSAGWKEVEKTEVIVREPKNKTDKILAENKERKEDGLRI